MLGTEVSFLVYITANNPSKKDVWNQLIINIVFKDIDIDTNERTHNSITVNVTNHRTLNLRLVVHA